MARPMLGKAGDENGHCIGGGGRNWSLPCEEEPAMKVVPPFWEGPGVKLALPCKEGPGRQDRCIRRLTAWAAARDVAHRAHPANCRLGAAANSLTLRTVKDWAVRKCERLMVENMIAKMFEHLKV